MTQNYIKFRTSAQILKSTLLFGLIMLTASSFAQSTSKKQELDGNLTINSLTPLSSTGTGLNVATRSPIVTNLASTITPSTQAICSGTAITSITATSPAIIDALILDALTGGAGTLLANANTGIFFDITNSGTVPIRINGLTFATFAATATTGTTTVPFTVYRTTTATTAVGNYTTAANWTSLGIYNFNLAATAANSGWLVRTNFNDNGFTLAPGASRGMYIVCNNAIAASGFKLGWRTAGTTGAPISNPDVTVTHRVRGTGLFATDSAVRGFYGNVLYQKDTYGYWTRDNTATITGTTTAGDAGSGVTPFPIAGTLTNNTASPLTTTYTIVSYDVNGVKDTQTVTVTVNPTPINTVTLAGNTFTADQAGATYQWFDCDNANAPISGETQQSFVPSISGNFGVTVTLNGCPVNSACTSFTLSTSQFAKDALFELYPNPNKGTFTIKSQLDIDFSIINQLGQVVQKFKANSGIEKNISAPNLSKGIYILSGATTDGKKVNKKMIVN